MALTEIELREPVPEDYRPVYFLNVPSKRSLHVITVKPPNLLLQGQSKGSEVLDGDEVNLVLDWIHETIDEIRAELRYRAGILDLPPLDPPGGKEGRV